MRRGDGLHVVWAQVVEPGAAAAVWAACLAGPHQAPRGRTQRVRLALWQASWTLYSSRGIVIIVWSGHGTSRWHVLPRLAAAQLAGSPSLWTCGCTVRLEGG